MNQKLGQERSINTNEDILDTNEKQQDLENKRLCANCYITKNKQNVKHNQCSINQIKQAKQFIQSDRSTQLQAKLTFFNNLNDSIEQLRNFYTKQIDQISQSIKTWSQQLIDEEDVFINKLQSDELIDYTLFIQFIKEQYDVQIQDQTNRIKKINCSILDLKDTDLVKKCLDLLENYRKPYRFELNNRKENNYIDEELNLLCEDHNKQITLFDLSSERSIQKRIGCLDCLDGTINQYTSIKRAQIMWQQIQQKRIEKMNHFIEILKIKVNSIKEYFLAMQKGFNYEIDNAKIKFNLNYEDYIQQVDQTISNLVNISWQSLTKEQINTIAQDLSQINQLSNLEDSLFEEFSIKENLVYQIAKDTMKSLQEVQTTFFDQIIHLISKQSEKNINISLQYHQKSANNIASQSTNSIDQMNPNSIVLEHKQQDQQLSFQIKNDKINIQDQSQSFEAISTNQQFRSFTYKLIKKNSIQQNEFCRAIAFNKDCIINKQSQILLFYILQHLQHQYYITLNQNQMGKKRIQNLKQQYISCSWMQQLYQSL